MGYFIRFIHNRDLAAENIMTAYSRFRVILDSPPAFVFNLLKRLRQQGHSMPARSMLTTADELRAMRGQLPGEYGLDLRPSRRNSRQLEFTNVPRDLYSAMRRLFASLGYPSSYKPVSGTPWIKMIAGNVFILLFLLGVILVTPVFFLIYRFTLFCAGMMLNILV